MISGSNPLLVPSGNKMHVGKGINIPVNQNPFLHLFGEKQIILSLHIIAHKISNNDLLIAYRTNMYVQESSIFPVFRISIIQFEKSY